MKTRFILINSIVTKGELLFLNQLKRKNRRINIFLFLIIDLFFNYRTNTTETKLRIEANPFFTKSFKYNEPLSKRSVS